mgnify:CR=1 FL=1
MTESSVLVVDLLRVLDYETPGESSDSLDLDLLPEFGETEFVLDDEIPGDSFSAHDSLAKETGMKKQQVRKWLNNRREREVKK